MDRAFPSCDTGHCDALLERGAVALRGGDAAAALECFEQVCRAAPHRDDARHFLGVAAMEKGDLDKALKSIEQSLLLCNTKASYFVNYGRVLFRRDRPRDALKMFTRATVIAPELAEAWEQLGIAELRLHGPTELAEQALRRALELDSNRPDALYRMAECLSRRKRYDAALLRLQRLNVVRPRDLHVLEKLAQTCEKTHDLEDAVAYAHQAEILAPDSASIQHDLGRLHGGLGNVALSKFHYQRGAAMPGGHKEWRWKHLGHCPQFFESDAQIEAYWQALETDLDKAIAAGDVYDWRTLVRDGFAPPFQLPHLNRCCRPVKEKFTELFARSFEGQGLERPARDESREKLRVGFLVTPGHEGGFLRLTRDIIERIDGERFEPVLIYHQQSQKRLATHFRRRDLRRVAFGPELPSAVEQVRAAKCDVIYYWKVGADVWSFLLPMARLARVQCTSWSTHGTSGHRFIDYYVSWDRAEPACAQEQYTEDLYLFDCSPLYEPRLPVRSRATRADLGLPESGAIYYCPHRAAKYHPMFDAYLDDILSQDASGHAVLLVGNDRRVADRLKERMRRSMRPSAASRLICLPHQTVDSYYRHLSVASVVLNSPIYAGEITSIDGFLYDVPSVARTGELLVQRYTTAFYEFLGIDDFAQNDQHDYVRQAVRLGTDRDYRRHIVEKIRAGSDRFFDRPETIERWESFVESAVDSPVGAETAEG